VGRFERGNVAALKHGVYATKNDQIGPVARAQKRRLLRQNRLRAKDLDGLGLALLDNWSRAQAKVELLDRDFDANGFLDGDGNPRGGVAVYFAALNSAARTLTKLEAYMRDRARDPVAELNRYLGETFEDVDDGAPAA